MNDPQLIFWFSTKPIKETVQTPFRTPFGTVFIRMMVYRGGSNALDYANRNCLKEEIVLNTIELELVEK
jgi:hypothetical protein